MDQLVGFCIPQAHLILPRPLIAASHTQAFCIGMVIILADLVNPSPVNAICCMVYCTSSNWGDCELLGAFRFSLLILT